MKSKIAPSLFTSAVAVTLLGAQANAAPFYWNATDSTNAWADGSFWSDNATSGGTTGTVPGALDTAVFNQSTVNGATVASIANVDTSVGGLVFNNTGTTNIAVTSNNTILAIGAGGITIDTGAGAVSFGTTANGQRVNLALSASQTWLNNSTTNILELNARNPLALDSNTLTFGGAGDFTQAQYGNYITARISGAGSIVKSGTGTLTLTQENTFTGSTTIEGGKLVMLGDHNKVLQNSWLDTAGSITGDASNGLKATLPTFIVGGLAGDKALASIFTTDNGGVGDAFTRGGYDGLTALTLRVDAANSVSYSGDIADGAAGMTVSLDGGGVQTLSGDNTYTGQTTLSSGTLNINSATALGTGTFVINGGTFDNTSGSARVLTNNQAISLGNTDWTFGGTDDLNLGTGDVALNLPVGGSTNVITLGGTDSTLTFGGHVAAANRNGNTTIQVDGAGNTLVFGSLALNDSPLSRDITFTGSGNITVNGAVSDASNSDDLIYAGTGTFTLGGAGTYTGQTIVTNGTLQISNSLAMQNSSLNTAGSDVGGASNGLKTTVTTLTFGGLTGDKDLASVFTNTSGGYDGVTALTLNLNTGKDNTYSGAVANGASGMSLDKTGEGTQTLTGDNTYTGATTVTEGTLLIDGTNTSVVTVNGGTFGGSGSSTGGVTVNSGGTLSAGNSIESLGLGNVTIDAGTFVFELNTTTANADLVYGSVDATTFTLLNSPLLSLVDLGSNDTLVLGTKLTLFAYDGAWNNGEFSGYGDDSTFAFAGNQWQIDYNDAIAGSNFNSDATLFGTQFVTMTVVPEPSTIALIGFGFGALFLRRRRS